MKLGYIKMVPPIKNAYARIINQYYVFGEKLVGPTEFELTIEENSQDKYTVRASMSGTELRLSVEPRDGQQELKDRAKEIEKDIKEW